MKKIVTLFLIVTNALNAQITWDFSTATPSSGVPSGVTVGAVTNGNNNGTTTLLSASSVSSGYTGATGTNNAGAAVFTGALNTETSTYFAFTVTVDAGKTVMLTGIKFGVRRTNTGPQAIAVRQSGDSYATSVSDFTQAAASTWELKEVANFSSAITISDGQSVTFRIYGHSGTGSPAINTANWRIDDLVLTHSPVMPVEFHGFKAVSKEATNALNWQVGNEQNISHYTIERSADNTAWTSIGTVKAYQSTSYNFIDEKPLALSYYRVRSVEADGSKGQVSKVVSVSRDNAKKGIVRLYPQPTNATATVDYLSDRNTQLNVVLTDITGRAIWQQTHTATEGINQIGLNTEGVAKGIYLLKIGTETVKFVKQ